LRINITETLKKSIIFYKENFKFLVSFSLIMVSFLVSFALLPRIFIDLMYEDYSGTDVLLASILLLIGIILIILFIIWGPKLYLAIAVLINSLFDGKKITLKEAYKQTEGKYWSILGSLICIFLMGNLSTFAFQSMNIVFTFDFIFHILFRAYVWSSFYLIYPVIALEQKGKNALGKTRRMVKRNHGAILVLYLLTTSLLNIIYSLASTMLENYFINILALTLIHYTIFFFVFPFAQTVIVVVYRMLIINETFED